MPPKGKGKKRQEDEEAGEAGEMDVDAEYEASQATQKKSKTQHSQEDGGKEKENKHFNEMPKQDRDRKISEMVRFILFKNTKMDSFTYEELKKIPAPQNVKATMALFEEAKKVLADIFSLEVVELPTAPVKEAPLAILMRKPKDLKYSKSYVTLSTLNPKLAAKFIKKNEDMEAQPLLMVILGIIFINNHEVSEKTLMNLLKKLQVESDKRHAMFGNIGDLLKRFISQKYLLSRKEMDNEGPSTLYRWGSRACVEMTDEKCVEFIAKVYGEDVDLWMQKLGYKKAAGSS